jgi:hypothetical protein
MFVHCVSVNARQVGEQELLSVEIAEKIEFLLPNWFCSCSTRCSGALTLRQKNGRDVTIASRAQIPSQRSTLKTAVEQHRAKLTQQKVPGANV